MKSAACAAIESVFNRAQLNNSRETQDAKSAFCSLINKYKEEGIFPTKN